jgi:hypothetical protein
VYKNQDDNYWTTFQGARGVQQQDWTLMLMICRVAQLRNEHPMHRVRPLDRVGLTPLSPNGQGAIMLHPFNLHFLQGDCVNVIDCYFIKFFCYFIGKKIIFCTNTPKIA